MVHEKEAAKSGDRLQELKVSLSSQKKTLQTSNHLKINRSCSYSKKAVTNFPAVQRIKLRFARSNNAWRFQRENLLLIQTGAGASVCKKDL